MKCNATRSMPIVFNIKIAICQIFAATTLACHFVSSRRGYMLTLLSRALTRVCEGWQHRFRLNASEA